MSPTQLVVPSSANSDHRGQTARKMIGGSCSILRQVLRPTRLLVYFTSILASGTVGVVHIIEGNNSYSYACPTCLTLFNVYDIYALFMLLNRASYRRRMNNDVAS